MKILQSIILLFLAAQLYAVPARRYVFKAKMSDGTYQSIRFCGDENRSFYLSEDGYLVEPDVSGDFYIKTSRRPEELPVLRVTRATGIGQLSTAPLRSSGSPEIPVILVNFSDEKMTVADTDDAVNSYYDKFCNGTYDGNLYKDAGSYGSVRDYFVQQSDSVFLPHFHIIGPVTLSKPMAYYGQNSESGSKDINFMEFCRESMSLAMEIAPNIATDFDNDRDGSVDMAFFIYAGLPESDAGVTPDAIWPKEYLSSMNVNGITVSVMACCSELTQIRGEKRISGIGTMCHEVSHSLGLPDQYDVNSKELGMSFWSLMDSGNYCGNGYYPCGMTGYERDFLNWRPLRTLTESCTVRLRPIEDGGISCKVVNRDNPDEYYILDNRAGVGWDGTLCRLGHGMLVTHVDYDKSAWTSNRLNTDGAHQRMSFIPANNSYIGNYNAGTSANLLAAMGGQPYPGTSHNTLLTDWSTPASTVFTGELMGKPITQIRELENGDIVFKFMPQGTLSAPEDLSVKNFVDGGFTLEWKESPDAECYMVNVYGVDEEENVTATPVFAADSVSAASCTVDVSYPDYKRLVAEVTALADKYEDSEVAVLDVDMPVTGIREGTECKIVETEVYTLQGVCLGKSAEVMRSLPEGVYIFRTGDRSKKIIIH